MVADTETLRTLPDRELSAGLAEMIKYGLIDDPELFTWLEGNMGDLRARDAAALAHAIERPAATRPRSLRPTNVRRGRRALLNLGHTFGHAIETGVGYGEWLHGEAVGAGLCMAADLSRRLGWITDTELARIVDLVRAAGLPAAPPRGIATERFLELMAVDKKVLDGRLRLVLLKGIGKALITDGFPLQALRDTLEAA